MRIRLTPAPVDTTTAETAYTEPSRASTCTTTTVLRIRASRRCVATVASGSAVPARVAPGAAVETIATAARELASVATVTSFRAGTRRPIKAESVSTKKTCIRMASRSIRKKNF